MFTFKINGRNLKTDEIKIQNATYWKFLVWVYI